MTANTNVIEPNNNNGETSYTDALWYSGNVNVWAAGWPVNDPYITLILPPPAAPTTILAYSCVDAAVASEAAACAAAPAAIAAAAASAAQAQAAQQAAQQAQQAMALAETNSLPMQLTPSMSMAGTVTTVAGAPASTLAAVTAAAMPATTAATAAAVPLTALPAATAAAAVPAAAAAATAPAAAVRRSLLAAPGAGGAAGGGAGGANAGGYKPGNYHAGPAPVAAAPVAPAPPPAIPHGGCLLYFRQVQFTSGVTLLAAPPRDDEPGNWTLNTAATACGTTYDVVSIPISSAVYTEDVATMPWPGAPPAWCGGWGALTAQRPSGMEVTVRSANDPVVAAGLDTHCSDTFGLPRSQYRAWGVTFLVLPGLAACGVSCAVLLCLVARRRAAARVAKGRASAAAEHEGTPLAPPPGVFVLPPGAAGGGGGGGGGYGAASSSAAAKGFTRVTSAAKARGGH
jgi:hypothetical protein